MKIAGLGQKKNSEVDNYLDVELLLPELLGAKPAKAEELKVTITEVPKVVETPKAEAPKVAKVEEAKPTPRPKATTAPRPLISLTEIFNGGAKAEAGEAAEGEGTTTAESRIDSRSEELLEASRAAIMEYITSWRPRFKVPFEAMRFEANKIIVTLPTSELKTEVERASSELLHKVVEITGINGLVELEIILDEKIVATRPVKLEDKIAYLVKINPELSKFKEKFNLYVE